MRATWTKSSLTDQIRILDANGVAVRHAWVQPLESADHAAVVAGWNDRTLAEGKAIYDALCVANGHHWAPKFPEYPGRFTGIYMHSHDFKGIDDSWRGQSVLVIGAGVAFIKRTEVQHRVRLALGWTVLSIAVLSEIHILKGGGSISAEMNALSSAGGWMGWLIGEPLRQSIGGIAGGVAEREASSRRNHRQRHQGPRCSPAPAGPAHGLVRGGSAG